uniref:hemicentin-1-like n=1 Tax=Scatophagus argus TaxID=75038 RepID=UPI001ED841ED|nr:hemicentin-1-like [Scatophagus argus]
MAPSGGTIGKTSLRTTTFFRPHREMRGAAMSLSAAASGFVVFLLSVSVVQGQDGWAVTYTPTEICALRGSTVDMRCTYTYPSSMNGLNTTVRRTFWFARQDENGRVDLTTDPQYSGRVDVQCGDNDCTLRITDLRESDSAEYKFRFITNQPGGRYSGSPGVTLSVTDLQVQVTTSSSSSRAELTCHSSCRLPARPSFVWYKNGDKIQTQTSSSYSVDVGDADSYSCAVAGHEDSPSPPVCVHGQSCNKVTYADRRICAFKGSSVDISCTYNSYYRYIRSKLWFSPGRSLQWQSPSQLDSQHRVQVLDEGGGRSTLRISDLRESDSAEYRFTFTAGSFEWGRSLPATTLTVTDPDLQVQVTTSSSSSRAELTCHSSCRLPARPSFVWYKNGEKIETQTSSSYSVDFDYVNSYSCAVAGHEDSPSPPVCVRGQSCNKVTYADRRICAVKGSSVDISCTYNRYYRYNRYTSYEAIRSKWWFSPGRSLQWQSPSQPEDLSKDSQYSDRVQIQTWRGYSSLRISDLRESDSAEYRFTFTAGSFEWGRSLPATTLTVTDVQVQVSRISVSQSYTEAELKCHSSCSPAARLSYVWFRNGTKISGVETSSYKDGFYVGDVVSCALKGHEDYVSASVLVQGQDGWAVTYTPTEICALRGSTVDMRCTYTYPSSMNGLNTTVERTFWFARLNGNGPLDLTTDPQYSGRVDVQCGDNDCTLRITDLRESDSAEYKFRFITNQPGGRYSGSPGVTLSVTDPDLQVQVTTSSSSSRAELTCHSSCRLPARPSFVWYKNGEKIETQTSSSYSGYFDDADSYSCAVAGHEDSPSPPVCVRGQSCNKVTYADRRICAVKGSSVDISCTYNSYRYIRSKLWFSPGRSLQWQSPSQLDSQHRVQVLDEGGGRSTLRISDLRESDSAEYRFTFTAGSFEWGRSLPATTLTVTDLQVQVRPSSSSTWAELTCHSSCRLPACPSYVWYKNGDKIETQTSSSYSVDFGDVDSYSCAVAGHEDSPSPPVCVRGQSCNKVTYDDRRICAVKGSSVDISCTYNSYNSHVYPVTSKLWFSPGRSLQWQSPSQLDSQHRVQVLDEGGGRSTLRISDLRESDSAEYRFTFTAGGFEWGRSLPATTLTVTDVQVQVSRISVSQSYTEAELKCHSSCSPAARLSYVWFRNGTKISGGETSSYKDGFYVGDVVSCALKGHEDYVSASVLVQGQDGWAVTYTPTEICALRGSTVDMRCTYTYPSRMNGLNTTVERTFWHTLSQGNEPVDLKTDPQYSGRVDVQCGDNDCTLRITDLRESDSAEYKFRFITNQPGGRYSGSPGVTLSVTDPDLQVQVRTLSSNRTELTCHSSCRLPTCPSFVWYKNGEKIETQTCSSYSVDFGDADSYSCAVAGHEDSPSPPVCVRGQSCNKVTYADRRICAVKGSSVDISCTYYSYNRYIRSKLWFSPGRSLQWQSPSQLDSQRRVQVLDEGGGRSTLRISDLRESDSAEYRFTFTAGSFEWGRSLPATTLTVTDVQVQVSRISVSQSYTEAELKCHSSCSPAARLSYVWFRNGTKISGVETSSYKDGFYVGDVVSCALKGHEDYVSASVYGPKLPSVSVSPSAEIVEGSSVTLSCSSDANPAANYTRYKTNGNGVSFKSQLVFSSIQSSDSGQYYCTAENELGRTTSESISVDVKYGPKLPSVSVSPSAEIVEGSSVTLSCSSDANPAANYTWYKEDEDSPKASGQKFTITDFRAEHSGNYSCEAQNIRGSHRNTLHLTVADTSIVTMNIIRLALTAVMLISLLLFVLCMRKKKTQSSTTEPNEAIEAVELESLHDYTNVSA